MPKDAAAAAAATAAAGTPTDSSKISTKTNPIESTNQNVEDKPEEKKKTDLPGRTIYKLICVFILILGLTTAYWVKEWMAPPPMPEVDLDKYWGRYPIDVKPDVNIKPYKIVFPDVIINDLKERLLHRRPLPQPLENAGFSYGFNSNFLTQVVDFWANSYKFKDRERFLNKFNQFTTKINGLNVHFVHVKPKRDDSAAFQVMPILMLHGWPSSIREFYEVIPRLVKPGGKNFVFEVIAPSLPGFGFSEAPTRSGFGVMEMAIVMHKLMGRLGFQKYLIQGGDLGHTIGSIIATLFPDKVIGFHTCFPAVFNPSASIIHMLGALVPSWMEHPRLVERMYPYGDYLSRIIEETGYMHIQATRPDTVGAALSDSPSGLAAYILEKFSAWSDPENKKAYDGNLRDKFTLTQLLDNVMIYWVTNSITTSVRVFAESLNKRQIPFIFERIPTEVPTWGVKFSRGLLHHSDRMLRQKYTNYLQSSITESGGHFANWENPGLMAHDIYYSVHYFREFHGLNKNAPTIQRSVYDFTVNDIHGVPTSLDKYEGYLLLIVNVASKCSLTELNYAQLNYLQAKYYRLGLRILAFPCNQFDRSEPGTSSEIVEFKRDKNIQLHFFEKVNVNGEDAAPLWKYLKQFQKGTLRDVINWNFSKFIVNRNGKPVQRFTSTTTPIEIEPYLVDYL